MIQADPTIPVAVPQGGPVPDAVAPDSAPPDTGGADLTVPDVTVVVAVTADDPTIPSFHADHRDALDRAGLVVEFIYVLDGNRPLAEAALTAIRTTDPRVRTITLARSFGEATSMMMGVRHAAAPVIATLTHCRQVAAGEVPRLVRALLDQADVDVLAARRDTVGRERMRGWLRRSVFAGLARMGSGLSLSDLGCRLRVFRREVADHLDLYGDQQHFLPILAARRGFKVVEVPVRSAGELSGRATGSARSDLLRLLDMAATLFLVNFVHRPLRFFGLIGLGSLAAGLAWTLLLIMERFVFDVPLGDRPALMFSMLLVALGIQVIIIGLVGEIIIFTRAKDMKTYVVDRLVN
ncbi:MAG: hypothetical protein RLY86_3470 [Pseudomonadota bacterium]|jgi:hypothetical protein